MLCKPHQRVAGALKTFIAATTRGHASPSVQLAVPSHADYTYQAKFGIRAWPGGGRTSARETIGRVAAGAIAKKILRERFGVEILAFVNQVQKICAQVDPVKEGCGH